MERSDHRYQATLHHLLDRINYEKSSDRPYTLNNFKLARMAYLLERLGNPHLDAPAIHIAGTKGKGSVCWLLAEAFRRSGLRTGLFTSPHLVDLEERFVVDSQAIVPEELVEIVDQIRSAEEDCSKSQHGPPTFFEMTTAMAWLAFRNRKTQVNVIEVGLGGRLDSTNVCDPDLCIITSISYDHQQQLGNSLSEIAGEKAGIIKPSIPIICGARAPEAYRVIQQKAIDQGSELWQLGRDFHVHWTPNPDTLQATIDYSPDYDLPDFDLPDQAHIAPPSSAKHPNSHLQGDHPPGHHASGHHASRPYSLRMLGKHQADNAALAIAAWDKLKQLNWKLNDSALAESLANTQVPARMEILSSDPLLILDTAHNEASIDALAETLESYFPKRSKSILFACSRDKKAAEMIQRLCDTADRIILTQFQSNPRFTPVEKLLAIAEQAVGRRRQAGLRAPEILSTQDFLGAIELSRQAIAPGRPASDAVHVITGSFFIATEAKSYFASVGPIR